MMYIKGTATDQTIVGIVYKAEENYYLLATIKGNYYINGYGKEIGDIIKVSGYSSPLAFSHYEGAFDFKKYLSHYYVEHSLKVDDVKTIYKSFIRINSFKSWCLSYLYSATPLAKSLLFGDSLSYIDAPSSLHSLGIAHLFSSSGLHISLIFNFLTKKLKEKKLKRLELSKVTISVLFCLLTSFKFGFIRILIDLILRICLKNKKIYISRISQLSILATILLIVNPYYALESSFQFCFVVLFFLEVLPKQGKPIKKYFITSLVTLPLVMSSTNSINLFYLVANYIFSPLAIVLFIFCIPLLFLPIYGKLLKYPLLFAVEILQKTDSLNLPLYCGEINNLYLLIIYLLLILCAYYAEIKYIKKSKISLSLFITSLIIPFFPKVYVNDYIRFIDVGQGDSTLLQISNKNYLIDTGGNTKIDLATTCLIPYFRKLKINSLEAVFITHFDYDHYGALESLKLNFPIKSIYYNDFTNASFKGFTIENLNTYRLGKDDNYDSSVLYIKSKRKSILLMGDAPKEIENKILLDRKNIKVDILKLGHHGSNTSSSFNFLQTIHPELAIISCGLNNKYHHPSSEVIINLNALNITYKRTDLQGTIVLRL